MTDLRSGDGPALYFVLRLVIGLLVAATAAACAPAGGAGPTPVSSTLTSADTFPSLPLWRDTFAQVRVEAEPVLLAMANQRMYLRSRSAQLNDVATDELLWDPPRSPNWEAIEPLLAPLNERAIGLYAEIAAVAATDATWRTRRALAEAAYHLVMMTEAMRAYYDATGALDQGEDGNATRELLVAAQRHWSKSESLWQQAFAPAKERSAQALESVNSDHRAVLVTERPR